jgi:hypothetical protein
MTLFQKIAPFALIALLSACATIVKMQPSKELPEVADVTKKATILLTAHIKNENNPGYQLRVYSVAAEKSDGKGGVEKIWYTPARDSIVVGEWDSSADLSLVMDPGLQTLRLIRAISGSIVMTSAFELPLHLDVNLKPGVYYGGHIEAVVRARVGNEFKAGPTTPLLQQGVSGASGGSFDVTIKDNYEVDVAALREKFPSLRNVEIQKAILPEWSRSKAQEWWEKN